MMGDEWNALYRLAGLAECKTEQVEKLHIGIPSIAPPPAGGRFPIMGGQSEPLLMLSSVALSSGWSLAF